MLLTGNEMCREAGGILMLPPTPCNLRLPLRPCLLSQLLRQQANLPSQVISTPPTPVATSSAPSPPAPASSPPSSATVLQGVTALAYAVHLPTGWIRTLFQRTCCTFERRIQWQPSNSTPRRLPSLALFSCQQCSCMRWIVGITNVTACVALLDGSFCERF